MSKSKTPKIIEVQSYLTEKFEFRYNNVLGRTEFKFKQTEGSFFETENEYTITAYYRPMGERYDRLIGYKTISSNHGLLRQDRK